MKNIISTYDFSGEEILDIVSASEKMIFFAREKTSPPFAPKNAKTTLLFLEPSTRTRGSYKEAAEILGMRTDEIVGVEATALAKRESFGNTVRMLAIQGADILVMRTPFEGAARFAAEILDLSGYSVAVQNGGDGGNQHPTQAFLDLLTIKQKLGRLDNFTIGIVGDLKYSRTVHSLMGAFSKLGGNIKIKLISVPEAALQEKHKEGLNIEEGDSLELLKGCDIGYVTRVQEKRYKDKLEYLRVKGRFIVDKAVLEGMKDILIMHPQPCDIEGGEIAPEIYLHPQVIKDEQAWYGISVRMTLLVEGCKHHLNLIEALKVSDVEKRVIEEESIDAHLKKSKKREKHFLPLKRGTLIDHLPVYWGDTIKRLLRKGGWLPRGEGTNFPVEEAKSPKFGKKDLLILENRFLPDKASALITLIAPNATFNIMDGVTFRKMKFSLPKVISRVLDCPNPDCITNNDPEAKTRFFVLSRGEKLYLECHYCERRFSKEEILSVLVKALK